jgi:hypothetical protein
MSFADGDSQFYWNVVRMPASYSATIEWGKNSEETWKVITNTSKEADLNLALRENGWRTNTHQR